MTSLAGKGARRKVRGSTSIQVGEGETGPLSLVCGRDRGLLRDLIVPTGTGGSGVGVRRC